MHELIRNRIQESILCKSKITESDNIIKLINEISHTIVSALKKNNKVMFAGNGGSFSDAFHLAGEFVSRFMFDRDALPALALGGNNSILTAIGNDYSFDDIFSRELDALGHEGDVLIAISTSGNSRNILGLIKTAKNKKIQVYGLTGETGGCMKDLCPCVCVTSEITARIQEAHIMIGHIICEIVERKIFKK
ncbi:MAG: SIS domain-containing protein [Candidatus Cloacimonetes bacterium]|nr:SIS domain-containing protein [Candidatus Cloacimonadota bacterium]